MYMFTYTVVNRPLRMSTHWNTLQHTATRCNTLQHTATHCNTLHHTAPHCNTMQHITPHSNINWVASKLLRKPTSRFLSPVLRIWAVAVCCSVLQCVTVCCSVLQCVAVRCSALQCVAVFCAFELAEILKKSVYSWTGLFHRSFLQVSFLISSTCTLMGCVWDRCPRKTGAAHRTCMWREM